MQKERLGTSQNVKLQSRWIVKSLMVKSSPASTQPAKRCVTHAHVAMNRFHIQASFQVVMQSKSMSTSIKQPP